MLHYYYIDLLRFLATLLITNSHYTNVWPISAMATGGSLGNTLFFAISGFCLSAPRNDAIQWFKKRILRIYPPVAIVTLIVFVFIRTNEINSIADVFLYFVYPTQFWFVSAMLVFYLLFYILVKYANKYINHVILLSTVVYGVIYLFILDTSRWSIESGTNNFKWIYYFIVMLIAYQMKEKLKVAKCNKLNVVMLILSIVLYFGLKLLMKIVPIAMHLQFLLHLISLVFVVTCFSCGQYYEKQIKRFMMSRVGKIVSFIGKIAFEIYLVQTFVLERFDSLDFPVSFIVVSGLILVFAVCLHMVSEIINRVLQRDNKRGAKQ